MNFCEDTDMKHRIKRAAALAGATLLAGACAGVNVSLWPFGGDKEQDPSRTPAGATAYQCENGKRLFVRYLENGAAWVILPEREFRLDKTAAASGTRYSNDSAALEIRDGVATLSDGAAVTHAGCKASGG
jgi:membrane-bound inhibitor of C-type lysozyme